MRPKSAAAYSDEWRSLVSLAYWARQQQVGLDGLMAIVSSSLKVTNTRWCLDQ